MIQKYKYKKVGNNRLLLLSNRSLLRVILSAMFLGFVLFLAFSVGIAFTSPPVGDNEIIASLGTKGPYPFFNVSWKSLDVLYPTLVLKQVQLITRHGTRTPNSRGIKSIDGLVTFFCNHSDEILFEPLRNLSNPWTIVDEGQLTEAGRQDLVRLGKISQNRYASLLASLQTTSIVIQSSAKSRVTDSAKAFAEAFLPVHLSTAANRIIALDKDLDADLRPSDTCAAFANRNEDILEKEGNLYAQSHFGNIAQRISTSIGLKRDNLSATQALSLIEFCAFSISALRSAPSDGICALFNLHDFEVYETYQDLISYYSYGYGDSFSANISCSLITSILDSISDERVGAHLRFTHAETLMPFIVSLGLFEDKNPFDSNTKETELRGRKWKTSAFTPFMGNVWIEKYTDVQDAKTYLRFIVDDISVQLPRCSPHPIIPHLCEVTSFVSLLRPFYRCNFDEICGNTVQTNGSWRTRDLNDAVQRIFFHFQST